MAPPSCEELGGGDGKVGTDKMGEDRDSCYDGQASVRPKVKDPSVRKKTHGRRDDKNNKDSSSEGSGHSDSG